MSAVLGRCSAPRHCAAGAMQQRRPLQVQLAPAVCPALARRSGRRCLVVRAAAPGLAHPGEEREGGLGGVPDAGMKWLMRGGMGSDGALGATLEREPLRFVMPTPTIQGPKLDDGGSGGSIGKHNHNGGGGGDDGGDDDDFFSGDDDGEGGDGEGKKKDGFLRSLIPESYDKLSIAAVFAEWMRTVADLPLILRRAVEMGLFSSAQLVRFFSMDVRPSLTRSLTRSVLPPSWARDFVGRLMADPAFAQKLALESCFAGSASLYYEYCQRGDKFKQELDLAFINSIGMAAATAATVWLLAPTRSYGSVHKFPWQQMLDGLPNCVFDASGPLRQYSQQARIGSFFAKMAELSAVGTVTGGVTSLACSAAVQLHKKADPSYEPSTSIPSVGRSSGGLATFFATSANIRYQIIGGLDRYLFSHSNYLWTYMAITGLARVASQSFGEMSRPWWQGLPPPGQRKQAVRTRRVSKKVPRRVPRASVLPAPAAAAAPAMVVEALNGDDASVSSGYPAIALSPVGVSVEARSADVSSSPAPAAHQAEVAPVVGTESPHAASQEQYQVAQHLLEGQSGLQGQGPKASRPLLQAA